MYLQDILTAIPLGTFFSFSIVVLFFLFYLKPVLPKVLERLLTFDLGIVFGDIIFHFNCLFKYQSTFRTIKR